MGIIHGVDTNGRMYELKVDTSGRILAVIDAVTGSYLPVNVNTMPITQVKGSNNNHLFTYESALFIDLHNSNLPAGTTVIYSSAVPANKVWNITHLAMYYYGTVAGVLIATELIHSSVTYAIMRVSPPVSNLIYDRQGQFILGPGDTIRVVVIGATAGDYLYLMGNGYQMDIS